MPNVYKRQLFASCIILFSLTTAAHPLHDTRDDNKIISQIYNKLNNKPKAAMSARIEDISAQFLNKPYMLGALGEGPYGHYDQWPLYRTDAFDCETYVDTVLALALANNSNNFKQCINQIRYQGGKVSYINRNHFTCLDWNQNNQQQHFVKDITTTLRDAHQQIVVKYARALIDKPAWYTHKSLSTIRINNLTSSQKASRLQSLQQEGKQLPQATSITPYIPLTALFDKKGRANHYLFKQIPNAAIIEIVRPNWDLSKEIGTHLNISHLGFAIWKEDRLLFREASSAQGQVVDVLLIDYLRELLKSPTIKGINIQIVQPQQYLPTAGCE